MPRKLNIEIKIEKKQIAVFLKEKNRILDSLKFAEDHNLSEKLLPSIEKLLKKNRLEIKNVKKMSLNSDIDENWTTHRIAQAVVNAFNLAVTCG